MSTSTTTTRAKSTTTSTTTTTAVPTMEQEIFHWPPLESDPAIFTKYLHSIGLSNDWEIGECYGLDEECLSFITETNTCVAAMIVNAERINKQQDKMKGDETMNTPFYMKQSNTLDNACGIIACLHAIFNNPQTTAQSIQPNSVLHNFWDKVKDQTPQQRCFTLETATDFKQAHKAFAMQGQSQLASSQDDVNHHYTAFVLLSDDRLVEFDGTKQGPLVIAENADSVVYGTAHELKRRLRDGEITESLSVMTLVRP